MSELDKLFADHQLYHSDFQMDHLITIRAGGTVYGQYKQALRELYKRYRGLKGLYSERELLQVDIDELAATETDNPFDARRNDINRKTKLMNAQEMDKNIEETEREFARFYAQSAALKEQVGELTPERRDALDRDMWDFKIREMAAVDYLTTGRLGVNTVEFIGSMPSEMRQGILEQIKPKQQAALIEWFETKNPNAVALPESMTNIRALLKD